MIVSWEMRGGDYNLMIYQNKNKPWKHICVSKSRFEKNLFFRIAATPNNKWMKPPRFHAMINLFFVSFWRDNSKVSIGVGFGKHQWQLVISGLL